MADFFTDLNRHIAAYEAAEAADEAARAIYGEDYAETDALDREDRAVIDYADVIDPDVPVIRGYGGDHRYEAVPGAFPTDHWAE